MLGLLFCGEVRLRVVDMGVCVVYWAMCTGLITLCVIKRTLQII